MSAMLALKRLIAIVAAVAVTLLFVVAVIPVFLVRKANAAMLEFEDFFYGENNDRK